MEERRGKGLFHRQKRMEIGRERGREPGRQGGGTGYGLCMARGVGGHICSVRTSMGSLLQRDFECECLGHTLPSLGEHFHFASN